MMEFADYIAIPYVAVVSSVETPDGEWVRRAEYPELPGCRVEARSLLAAMDQLEELRIRRLAEAYKRGEEIPVPRPPLRSGASGLSGRPISWIMRELDGQGGAG